jgi:hypothetical protein
LKLPAFIPVEYKKHQDSLVDKSSYRNTTVIYRPAGGKGGNSDRNDRDGGDRQTNTRDFSSNPHSRDKESGYKGCYIRPDRSDGSSTSNTSPRSYHNRYLIFYQSVSYIINLYQY